MASSKKIANKSPIRVSNAFISNILAKVDKKLLSRIEADAPIKRELMQNGVPFRNRTPLMDQIIRYILLKVSEAYKENEALFVKHLAEWEAANKKDVFQTSFSFAVNLDYKEIYKTLNPDSPKYSGGDLRHIADAINDLCTIEDVLIFPAKGQTKTAYIAIRSTILHFDYFIQEISVFGNKVVTGARVHISTMFLYDYPKLKSCTFVPRKGIETGSKIDKDKLTQHFYNVLFYSCGKLHQAAERIRATAQGIPENELTEKIKKALTYTENFDTTLNYKVKIARYKREHVFIKGLLKTAECLKQNGVITEFFITTAANGDKQTNWVINEKFITEK